MKPYSRTNKSWMVADGARVFLDRLAAPRLSHKQMDALMDDESVTFSLRNQ